MNTQEKWIGNGQDLTDYTRETATRKILEQNSRKEVAWQ